MAEGWYEPCGVSTGDMEAQWEMLQMEVGWMESCREQPCAA